MIKTEFTEKELKVYAEEKAKTIVIRSYDKEGNSSDDERATTESERKIIYSIIYGALLAIRNGAADIQSVKDTAEFIGDLQIPQMNGYDTIYNRIGKFNWIVKEKSMEERYKEQTGKNWNNIFEELAE